MISILTVLELIKDSNTEEGQKPFSLRWIKPNGEIGNKPKVVQHKKALYNSVYVNDNVDAYEQGSADIGQKSGYNINLKETGMLLLNDLFSDHPFNIPFFLIVEFNGVPVYHE